MILATNVTLPIGKVAYIEMSDTNGIPMKEKVPCLILREATRDEYEELFLDKWTKERLINTKGYNAAHFYEFSTD